jgi:hypothetical protein
MIDANGVKLCTESFCDPAAPRATGVAVVVAQARLMTLQGAGHGVERAEWPTIVDAIAEHTAATDRTSQR